MIVLLMLKAPSKIVVDDCLNCFCFFNYFTEKIRFGISCELSARQSDSHEMSSLISYFLKKKQKKTKQMSSAAVFDQCFMSLKNVDNCHQLVS